MYFWPHFRKRFHTPRIIQMDATECGATALGIVLAYYGRFVPSEELRTNCAVSREGVSVDGIVQAANHYGLETDAYETTADEDIKTGVRLPAILYWEYDHFVVLEGILNKTAYINDPATGPRSLPLDEFFKQYSGIYLELKPGPTFKKMGSFESPWKKLFDRSKSFKRTFVYLFLLQVCLGLSMLCIPVFSQIFIDKFVNESLPDWKWTYMLLFSSIGFLLVVLNWMQGMFYNLFRTKLAISFSIDFLWHILRLPVFYFMQRYRSEIVSRMTLNENIAEIITNDIIINLFNVIILSSCGVIMFFYNPIIASVAVLTAVFNLILLWVINNKRIHDYARFQQAQIKTVGTSYDTLQYIEAIKENAAEDHFFSRIAANYAKTINTQQEIGIKDIWLSVISAFSSQLSTVLLLGIGVWEVIQGSLTIGQLIAMQILLGFFLAPYKELIRFSTEIQTLQVDFARLDDVLKNRLDPTTKPRVGVEQVDKIEGNLELRKINFGYIPFETPFIQDLDLTVEKGEMVGIVGPIGSGKSTVAKLIVSLFEPWSGQILYNGSELNSYSRDTFSQSIAFVEQNVYLFAGSIRDNLTLWDSTIPDEVLIQSAKEALIHDEIMALTDGYSSLLIEDGLNFSDGQRQRLEIARALVCHPSILILDEATNAIDSEREKVILENIRAQGITCIVISHRLRTLNHCDRIVVLEQGKKTMEGTGEELKNNPGFYQKISEYEIENE